MSVPTKQAIEDYLNEVQPEDRCDCTEGQDYYAQVEDSPNDPNSLEEIVYEFTASEFEEFLDDHDRVADLAEYWENVANVNDDAAHILDTALSHIEALPPEDAFAAPYIAAYARSLFLPRITHGE